MLIRRLESKDYSEIDRMIKDEQPMAKIKTCETYILSDNRIKGFFTFYNWQGYPILQHFYVDKKERHVKYARELIKEYLRIIKDRKYTIINAKENYLKRIIEYYFRNARNFGDYYLVEV